MARKSKRNKRSNRFFNLKRNIVRIMGYYKETYRKGLKNICKALQSKIKRKRGK